MRKRKDKNCYLSALSLLARRDHSCYELKRKLKQRGYAENEIEATLAECAHLGYVDDRRFAHGYCQQLQRRGYGRRRIRHMLNLKKVPQRIVANVIERYCDDAEEERQCLRMLDKKLSMLDGEADSAVNRPKLYRFLLNKGFPPPVIQRVISKV